MIHNTCECNNDWQSLYGNSLPIVKLRWDIINLISYAHKNLRISFSICIEMRSINCNLKNTQCFVDCCWLEWSLACGFWFLFMAFRITFQIVLVGYSFCCKILVIFSHSRNNNCRLLQILIALLTNDLIKFILYLVGAKLLHLLYSLVCVGFL